MRPIRHPEWLERTSGTLAYPSDLRFDDALFARILRSPHPCAEVRSIDTRAASQVPGVAAVLTADDLPDQLYPDYGVVDRPALARSLVRHVGQEVAVVAAEDLQAADRALAMIDVQYRLRPAVTSLPEAIVAEAPRVHAARDRNVAKEIDRRYGDPERARASTAYAIRGRYHYGMQAHACMEPHTAWARWCNDAELLELWVGTQGPRNIRNAVATMLELDEEQVRVHRVGVGGDFGSRVRVSDIEVLAGALTLRTGRPVRLQLTREEEFAQTKHRHDFVIDLETGINAQGSLTYRDADVLVESGSYCHAGANELNYATILLAAQHRLVGAHVRGTAYYTNRRPGGSFRGAGGPQAVFAIESQFDELAEQARIDPVELRLRNLNRVGERTITGWEIDNTAVERCLDIARQEIEWDDKRGRRGDGRGVGLAVAAHVSGAHVVSASSRAEATVVIGDDGSVRILSGSSDPGTGESTVLAQICAQELGLDGSGVEVETMDTKRTPYDPGAGASRGTVTTGGAALAASHAAAEELRTLAAEKFGVAPADVELRDGEARADGDAIALGDLVVLSPTARDGELSVHRDYEVPLPIDMDADGFGNLSSTYGFAVHAVEVEVDRDTGQVRVQRVVAVHDSGTIINPAGATGQVTGGVAMALGAALGEQMTWEGGRLANPSYVDYHLPRSADMPPIDVVFVDSPSEHGPYGAKGLAEIALMPTAAALANAVAHATGVRVRELPITPDRILPHWDGAARAARPAPRWRRPSRWWVGFMRWAYPRGLHRLLHRWGTRFARRRQEGVVVRVEVPTTQNEAIAHLGPSVKPIGGGTDVLAGPGPGRAEAPVLVALAHAAPLNQIRETPTGDLVIGASVTLAALEGELGDSDPALVATVRSIASPQLRATATVAGNLCQEKRCGYYRHGFNCYKRGGFTCPCYAVQGDHRYFHAAVGAHRCQATTPSDLAVTLLALDAVVHVAAEGASRELTIPTLYVGPGETALRRDEIITAITVPAEARRRITRFEKLNLGDGGFALVSAAVSLEFGDSRGEGPHGARVVLGGVAPTPMRATQVETYLRGLRIDDVPTDLGCGSWASAADPLPGTAWKLDAATGLVRRTSARLLEDRRSLVRGSTSNDGKVTR